MEREYLDAVPSLSQQVLMGESLAGELVTPTTTVFHVAIRQSMKALGDVSVRQNSCNEEFERLKNEIVRRKKGMRLTWRRRHFEMTLLGN